MLTDGPLGSESHSRFGDGCGGGDEKHSFLVTGEPVSSLRGWQQLPGSRKVGPGKESERVSVVSPVQENTHSSQLEIKPNKGTLLPNDFSTAF